MIQIAWITDPHLDHAPVFAFDKWVDQVRSLAPDALIITGDISEAEDVGFQLRRLAEAFTLPIHFVLGNHDFYGRSIAAARRETIEICRSDPYLNYLTDCGPIEISKGCFLVGEDGWGDATVGNYEKSPVRLCDFQYIEDFRDSSKKAWKRKLQDQGKASAERIATKLAEIPKDASDVIIATHVPPFIESCWYEGRTSDENWAPFFVCGQVGKVLQDTVSAHQNRRYQVLCGHTHHSGVADMAPNLRVFTGTADYGMPSMSGLLSVDARSVRVDV